MNNIEIIQISIDYIEENLKTEITANELAQKVGFSIFHYYRIFQNIVGIPVMQYVLHRRLMHSLYEISQGNKIIDVALSYGFDTYAGFFKAFKREYNYSPSQYVKRHVIKMPNKINLKQEVFMITHKKLKEILSYWNLENEITTDIYYEETNNISSNIWYVGDSYLIKATTNLSALKTSIDITESLQKSGLISPTPIPTKDGQNYILNNGIYFSLTKRLKGNYIKSSAIYKNDLSHARYIGEIIGQLHLILKEHDKDIMCNNNNLFESVSNWALPEVKKIMNLPENFSNEYITTFGKLYDKLPKQIIHRDPNPSNIILENDILSGFIDFESSERNIRIFDPCYASTAILSETFESSAIKKENLDKWIEIYKNVILGYDTVCKLSEEEKQALPYVIFSIQMICIAYFSTVDKYKELAEINKKMLEWLFKNKDKLFVK